MRCHARTPVELHGPSVGIGAGITAVVIVAAFFAFGSTSQQEAELRPADMLQPEQEPVPLSVITENGSPVLGSPDAPVTLVEFGDYQCFFCNKFYHDTEELLLTNYVSSGKVKIIFKDYTIIGQDSVNAAHGAHCADDQGMFWEYHDVLYDNWDGEETGWAASENLAGFASEIGLDVERWSQCMLDKDHRQKIVSSNNDARALGLTGTPAFFVIGQDGQVSKIGGAQSYDVFEQVFESELSK